MFLVEKDSVTLKLTIQALKEKEIQAEKKKKKQTQQDKPDDANVEVVKSDSSENIQELSSEKKSATKPVQSRSWILLFPLIIAVLSIAAGIFYSHHPKDAAHLLKTMQEVLQHIQKDTKQLIDQILSNQFKVNKH